ncbi:uncharacterized protein LOC143239506 [Tachypleus tridentatus]|uniref:uncharacterized protein LOC143239506 n=1 Tax=Tachypleus tridentatus TaxID=6853 RepID=UPI003FD44EAA
MKRQPLHQRLEESQNKDNEVKRARIESEICPENLEQSTSSVTSLSELSPVPSAPTVDSVKQEEQYKKLMNSKFVVTALEGHSDVVWSVAAESNLVFSASRDTTVKVWDAIKGEEVCNLRGHTNSVSRVVFPSQEASAALAVRLECPSSQRLAISGALDCSLIVWSIPNGHLMKSIYTYNGITAVAIVEKELLVVTGTGKVT